MKEYDVIVIGSGSGALIAEEAAEKGLKTALIEKGPLVGGTCLNWGCIPSKQLIWVADSIVAIQEAARLRVTADITDIDFTAVMERMRESRAHSQEHLRGGLDASEDIDFYYGEGRFTEAYTLEVKGETLKGRKIFIASGSRPLVPPIKGLDTVDYLTNESTLELTEKPESLIIIGGGYIAVEFGHFFAAVGTQVTMLEMADRLILSEEPEVAALLEKKLKQRMAVQTGVQAGEVISSDGGVTVVTTEKKTGQERRFTAQRLLVAVGRRSNADLIDAAKAGIELDARGFIKTNELMETNVADIYAVGDANGQQMFTHMANREAAIVAHNVLNGTDMAVDYRVVPHAVYSHPQIASVGMLEADARKDHDIVVAVTPYYDTAKGEAMLEEDGFAKAIIDKKTETILGFHIIGPYAPELIQEVVNAMTSGGDGDELNEGIHIHPALSELIPTAINNAE